MLILTNDKTSSLLRNKGIIIAILLLLTGCGKPVELGFEINGSSFGFSDGTEVFLFDIEKGRDVQKSLVQEGKFRFYGSVEGIKKFLVHDSRFELYKTVWLDNSSFQMKVSNGDFESASTSGSEIQRQGEKWEERIIPLYKKREQLYKKQEKAEGSGAAIKTAIKRDIQAVDKEIVNQNQSFIKDHSDLKIVSFLLFESKEVFGKEITKTLYSNFQKDIKLNYWGRKLDLYLNHSYTLSIGDTIPEILLADISNKAISIGAYRGGYVLLEFWESSCHSCSDENAFLREAYRSYHHYGFEIYGISLDHEKSSWQQALERDSVSWTTVSDLEGFNGDIALCFQIEYLPLNYLINPQGIVLLKNIRGRDLSEELEKIYTPKTK